MLNKRTKANIRGAIKAIDRCMAGEILLTGGIRSFYSRSKRPSTCRMRTKRS